MEHHADKGVYPPIQVHVTLGEEDLTVKVIFFFMHVQACKNSVSLISIIHNLFSRERISVN